MNDSAAPRVRLWAVVVALMLLLGLWVFPQRLLDRPAVLDQRMLHVYSTSSTPVAALSGERASVTLRQQD